jgi:hypothetical protein
MIRAALDDSLSQTDRRYSFFSLRAELFAAALVLKVGKRKDVYAVAEERADVPEGSQGARVFYLVKCCRKDVPDFQPYRVAVPNVSGEVGTCSCVGFGRWGACKHLSTMTDLVHVQRIDPLE